MNLAIILAAGKSQRLQGINKIFYQIREKPLIFYTILAFERNPLVHKIILVSRKKDFKRLFSLIKKYKFKKIATITKGGKERQDSAFNGLKAAERLEAKAGDLILFHNGANPLISQKEIKRVIETAKKYKTAVIGAVSKDTVKKVDKNKFVEKTIPRENIYLVQTPQVIEYKLAKMAFEKAFRDKFYGTDDVSLVERLGKKVKVVPGNSQNIKVTLLEDLNFVKFYIKK